MTTKKAPSVLPSLPFVDQLALSRFEPADCARDTVGAGDFEAESVKLVMTYRLRISEPTEAVISAAVPWQRLALLALDRLNAETREAVVNRALAADTAADVDVGALKEATQAAADRLLGSKRAKRAGMIRGEVWVRPG